ncbi:MAG: hypothetical protein Q8M15_07360 [Bacteroidota bacterium]|nr:hypothetical protein [Bacteroidota bacterium]
MLKVKFCVWAKSATIDSLTDMLSVGNILEGIVATKFPAIVIDTRFVALIERNILKDPQIIKGGLNIMFNDKKISETKIEIDFKDLPRNRIIITIPAMLFDKEGIITFNILANNKKIGYYETDIIKAIS